MSAYIKYGSVGVSNDAIWESERGRIVLQVARNAVVKCELRRGSPEQKPLISAVLGLVLASPGVLLGQHALALLQSQATHIQPRYEAALVFIVGIGLWFVFRSLFRKRYYIAVATSSDQARLIFEGDVDLHEIRKFLLHAEAQFGWRIHDALPQSA